MKLSLLSYAKWPKKVVFAKNCDFFLLNEKTRNSFGSIRDFFFTKKHEKKIKKNKIFLKCTLHISLAEKRNFQKKMKNTFWRFFVQKCNTFSLKKKMEFFFTKKIFKRLSHLCLFAFFLHIA